MKCNLAKVLCLSGTVLFAQQAYASTEASLPADDELDLASIERDAKKFFSLRRIDTFRASLKPLLIANDRAHSSAPKLESVTPIINSPIIASWFNLCQKLYNEEQTLHWGDQRFEHWYQMQQLSSPRANADG